MEKTRFAGLTELAADESVLDDGAAFIGRDREVIDRLLQIGAKTHRHTGRSGISNPTAAPSASVVASGGTIGPALDIEIGYTLEDDSGGETLISPVATLTTPDALQAPTSAIAAAPDYTAGSLPLGDYYYGITYVDAAGGETPLGPVALVEREPGFLNAKVLVSGLAGGLATASAAAWKLYRAVNGGDFGYLASGVVGSYTDDGSVGTVGDITPPLDDGNATNSVNSLIVTLPTTGGIQSATYVRLYLTETGDFSGSTYLDRFPVASAGHTIVYTSLDFQDGQPPDVNLSIGGAQQIDPDSELLDWHWKRAVASVPALGSGVLGDVRMVTADGSLWGVLHPSAATSQGWTELGASAALTVTDADGPLEQGVVKLVFGGSGEVSVGVTDLGGGSAKVSIFAPSAQAPPFAESDITGLIADLAGKQPIDSDLTAIAALTTMAFGRALLTLADAAAVRASLGVSPIAASAQGPRLTGLAEIDFVASGNTAVKVDSLGGGSGLVVVSSPSRYRTLTRLSARAAGTGITASGVCVFQVNALSLPTVNNVVPVYIYLDPADHDPPGTPVLRVTAGCLVNDTAPAATITVGLYPAGTPTGGVGIFNPNLGAVVTGSTIPFVTPGANTVSAVLATADFPMPPVGWYCLGANVSAALAANSDVLFPIELQVRNR